MAKIKDRFLLCLYDNRHRLGCMAVCVAVLCCMSYMTFSLLNVVTVQDATSSKTVVTLFSDQDKLLSLAGYTPDDDNQVLYTTFPDRYTNITITEGFDVPITVDGTTVTAHIHQGTVQTCLENAGIVLGEHDYTQPSLNSPVDKDSSIRVYRVEYRDNVYEEAIPYGTEYRANSLIYRFKKRQYVLREGVEGMNLVTYRERYVDGEMESALVTKIETVREPVNQLVLKYAHEAISPLAAPAGVEIVNNAPTRYKQVISNVPATGYYSSRGKGASGLGLFYGSVAVNPNIIPYGSKLYITSPDGEFIYGFAIATDTGTALMQGIIGVDLFYETYKESSLNWKNNVNIYIIE